MLAELTKLMKIDIGIFLRYDVQFINRITFGLFDRELHGYIHHIYLHNVLKID